MSARRCRHCNRDLPDSKRPEALFCNTSCRVAHWRKVRETRIAEETVAKLDDDEWRDFVREECRRRWGHRDPDTDSARRLRVRF